MGDSSVMVKRVVEAQHRGVRPAVWMGLVAALVVWNVSIERREPEPPFRPFEVKIPSRWLERFRTSCNELRIDVVLGDPGYRYGGFATVTPSPGERLACLALAGRVTQVRDGFAGLTGVERVPAARVVYGVLMNTWQNRLAGEYADIIATFEPEFDREMPGLLPYAAWYREQLGDFATARRYLEMQLQAGYYYSVDRFGAKQQLEQVARKEAYATGHGLEHLDRPHHVGADVGMSDFSRGQFQAR